MKKGKKYDKGLFIYLFFNTKLEKKVNYQSFGLTLGPKIQVLKNMHKIRIMVLKNVFMKVRGIAGQLFPENIKCRGTNNLFCGINPHP